MTTTPAIENFASVIRQFERVSLYTIGTARFILRHRFSSNIGDPMPTGYCCGAVYSERGRLQAKKNGLRKTAQRSLHLRWANLGRTFALTGRSLLRSWKNASLYYRPRCFSNRVRMMYSATANRSQIVRMTCHILRYEKARPQNLR